MLLALLSLGISFAGYGNFFVLAQATNNEAHSEQISNIRLVVRLSLKKVYLYRGDSLIASYPIAIGRKGWETPTGNFTVLEMVRDPDWENPFNGTVIPAGPNNPLGERWIGFWSDGRNTIGFHGTQAEHLIGQAVSHGCIRMRNRDVKALFEKVRVGTPVIIKK